jgi:hypothetical protein
MSMLGNTINKATVFVIFLALLVFGLPNALESGKNARGNLTGYLFEQDGTAPVEGAVVKLRNVSTDEVFESTVSDSSGVFTVSGLTSGYYDYAVSSFEGNFVGVRIFGFKASENEKETISITLKSFNKEKKAVPKEFPPPQPIKDATYIGRVLSFDPKTDRAEVFIEEGMLRKKDLVRILGKETDFDMKVNTLYSDKNKVDYLSEGDTGYLEVKKKVAEGDALYLSKDKGLLPMLLIFAATAASSAGSVVIGAAETTAGTKGIVFDIPDLKEECEPTSPFRNKKR